MNINNPPLGTYTNNLGNHEARSTPGANDTRAVTHRHGISQASHLRHLHDIGASLARAAAKPQPGAMPSQVKYKGKTYEKVPVMKTAHDGAYFIDPHTQTLIGLDLHVDGYYTSSSTSGSSEAAKAIVSASANVNLPESLALTHHEPGAKAAASVRATGVTIQPASMSVQAFLDGINAGHTWTRTLPDGTELGLRKAFPLDTKMLGRFMESVSPDSLQLRFGRPFASSADIERFAKSSDVTTLVASVNGKMVGFANICSTEESEVCEMGSLVHQDYQGKKIGKALLNERNSVAKALGFKRIENLVDKNNHIMINWVPRQPGFISMQSYKQDPQWNRVLISLEHEGMGVQPPASMHAYVRPQDEAGETVERKAIVSMSAEESARLAAQSEMDEEELGY